MGVPFTTGERAIIRAYYEQTPEGAFDLDALCHTLKRPRTSVCRVAGQMGLTQQGRALRPDSLDRMGRSMSARWAQGGHPRGFAGHHHSEETREVIGAASREAWTLAKATGTGPMADELLQRRSDFLSARQAQAPAASQYSRGLAGRRADLGGLYVRSAWEANYARYLNWLKDRGEIEAWEYEPAVFWFEAIKRGVRSYKPDFRITERGHVYYVELKGWMTPRSRTALKRMAKYHPDVDLRLVDAPAYRAIAKTMRAVIPGWESPAKIAAEKPGIDVRVEPLAPQPAAQLPNQPAQQEGAR